MFAWGESCDGDAARSLRLSGRVVGSKGEDVPQQRALLGMMIGIDVIRAARRPGSGAQSVKGARVCRPAKFGSLGVSQTAESVVGIKVRSEVL